MLKPKKRLARSSSTSRLQEVDHSESPIFSCQVDQAVIPEGTCQSGSFSPAFRNRLSQLGKTYNLLT